MRKLILVAGACLALSACAGTAHLSTAQQIDLGCELAVLGANTAQDVAAIAQQHGADPAKADKLARDAAMGHDVVGAICTVATAIGPSL